MSDKPFVSSKSPTLPSLAVSKARVQGQDFSLSHVLTAVENIDCNARDMLLHVPSSYTARILLWPHIPPLRALPVGGELRVPAPAMA